MTKKFTELPIATSLNGTEITAIVKDEIGVLTSEQATVELIKNYVLTGNAATATKLVTSRTINGVAFDGTQNINITATLSTGGLATGLLKSTTVTGAISIAAAGTDYQAPIGTIAGIVKGNGANALTAAVAGTDYQSAQSVTGIVKSSGTTRSAAVAGTDYIAPYASQSANTHLAAPSGVAGVPTFRLLTTADIPSTLGATAHTGSVTLNASANLIFTGSASGTVTFSAGATPAVQTYTLPTAYPTVNGHVLSSTTSGVMTWTTAGVSITNLDSLTDVTITTPTTGQVLKYNGSIWINDVDAVSGGGVATVSVVSANGFAGTVATATSTPAITITTSITGVLKGNGTAVSAAVAGTDYQTPITFTTTGSSGAATFNGTALNIPQYTSGASAFTGLSDASSAGLSVDKIYLQAITNLTVTANGSAAYLFDQYTGDNPTIYAISGTTIAFNLGTGVLSSHPFLIRTSLGANYNTGLVHVSTSGTVSTGTNAQGKTSGTLYWKIPDGITGNYQYVCQSHGSMLGVINISTSGTNPQFNSIGVGTAASTTTGEIRATNNITAYYSDDRLKTRLGPIENALDKLDSLDTFYYEANAVAQSLGYVPIKEVGLSAQQVKAIMPEVVAPAPIDDKYLTVRYERLVPLLVAAINELTAKVKALEIK